MSLSLSTFTKLLLERPVGRWAVGEPRAKGCLARRTTAHNERPGAQSINIMVAIGPTKDVLLISLSENLLSSSLSSIHILYNQALVGGLSDTFDPATRNHNLQLPGGSTLLTVALQCPVSNLLAGPDPHEYDNNNKYTYYLRQLLLGTH